MAFKKFQGTYLFTGEKMLSSNNVLITTETGTVVDMVKEDIAGEDIQKFDGIICPGFVNCHCHLELSFLKGIVPEKTGLVSFLIEVISKRDSLSNEKIYEAIENAEAELFNSGTVAIGDVANTLYTLPVKEHSRINFYNFIEVLGFTDLDTATRLELVAHIAKQFDLSIADCLFSISPHAPYSVSKKMFELINENSLNKTITVHNQETPDEDELYINRSGGFFRLYDFLGIDASFFKASGITSLQTYLPWLSRAKNIILVHNTFTSQEDLDFAKQLFTKSSTPQLYWCLCANANLYIEDKLPPVDLLHQNNCKIVIGTDSYASNHSLNIIEEIKTIILNSPASISLDKVLQWATLNGAEALQMQHSIGSFDKGKQPGIVLIDNLYNQSITEHSTAIRLFN